MKLPRLSRLKKTTPTNTAKGSGIGIKFYISGAILLLVAFIVSVYLFFPARALKERVVLAANDRLPLEVKIDHLSLRFPPGLEGRGIAIQSNDFKTKPIEVSDLKVGPIWSTLIGHNPGIAFDAHVFNGMLQGTVRRKGDIVAHATRISFNEPLMAKSSLELSGLLEEGIFSGTVPLQNSTTTHLDLTLHQIRLTGLAPFGVKSGNLRLGNIFLKVEGRSNSFRIDKLEATGGQMEVTGGGTLLVVKPMDRSRLNINIVLRPAPNLDKSLTDLLNLVAKPGRDRAYRFQLTGSLRQPAIR